MATTAAAAPSAQRPRATGAAPQPTANVLDLVSVRRLVHGIARDRSSMTDGQLVGAWTDVSLVLTAVAGTAPSPALTYEEAAAATSAGRPLLIPVTAGAAQRDATADGLLALGYSAREAADVVSHRISQHALDTARRMIAVGMGRQQAANYLDRQYRQAQAAFAAPRPAPGDVRRRPRGIFDALIDRYAALHRVESNVVRAIIATESDFNPVARSRAGALGLMQLMPGTARELGVNPLVPEQNIEGGVRYFSQLLKMFGTLELALVAYNAGPGYALRYARGQTGLYGETREYVARVLTRLEHPPAAAVRQGAKTR